MKIGGPLESSAVEELLSHARGFELGLSEENVDQVLQAAGMLQFEVARKICCNFLKVYFYLFEISFLMVVAILFVCLSICNLYFSFLSACLTLYLSVC